MGWRPPAACGLGALLLLLGASFLVPAPPGESPSTLVTAARAAFVLLSAALALATLARMAGSGRAPSGGTGGSAPPAAAARPPGTAGGPTPEELAERNRELLAHHRITKQMMRARTSGAVFRVLLEGIREGLGYPGAVMAFLDIEGNLVFPPSPGGEGVGGFPGHTVPAVAAGDSFFFPLLETDEPAFVDAVPDRGAEEYRSVAGGGASLVIPLFHRGWAGDHDGEGEGIAPPDGTPRFRPALVVLRPVPGGREISPAGVSSILALLNEAELALEMTDLYRRLRSLSVTDGLTGLLNHREFYDRLAREAERAKRYSHSISVLLLDVDDFKAYNDRYGHPAGDNVLRILASLLRQSARGTDIVARYGGEEFAVILPESTSTGALLMAERIRTALSAVNLSPTAEGDVRLTASFGIFTSEKGDVPVDTMVSTADDALYRAKKDGKNRVIVRAGK